MKFIILFIFLISAVVTNSTNSQDYADGSYADGSFADGSFADGSDELITDFEFGDENPTHEDSKHEEFDNDVDYDEEDQQSLQKTQISAKEAMVRQVILNSMKTPEMKDKVAKVLPILRVMSPDQKLALATLVTTQVLAPPQSKGLSLEEVCIIYAENYESANMLIVNG